MQLADSKDFTAFDLRFFFDLDPAVSGTRHLSEELSVRAVDNPAADNRRDHLPGKLPSVERRVVRQ